MRYMIRLTAVIGIFLALFGTEYAPDRAGAIFDSPASVATELDSALFDVQKNLLANDPAATKLATDAANSSATKLVSLVDPANPLSGQLNALLATLAT